jgi:hypothetical protein
MDALREYPINITRVYQTDPEFSVHPEIRHDACYFISMFAALCCQFGMDVSHSSVLDFYLHELADGNTDVDNEMFIGNPQNLIDDLVGKGRVLFLGERGSYYICEHNEIEWGCWHRPLTDFNHFTWNDGMGHVIHDPWMRGGSASVAQGRLIGKRVARLL